MFDQNELEEAQAAVDRIAPVVRAAIAELEIPWTVNRSVEIEPPGDPFQPWRVLLERFGGREHYVMAVPEATSRSEAVRMAAGYCRSEQLAYERAVRDVLKAHGADGLLNKLNRLKAESNPTVVLLGPAPKSKKAPEGSASRPLFVPSTQEEAEALAAERGPVSTLNKW